MVTRPAQELITLLESTYIHHNVQCTTEPVLSSLFVFPLSDTRHQKSWLVGEFWVRNLHKTLPPGMN